MNDSPPVNRLIREKSPYLLQHADNPVDWYPWGEEAFRRARQEDKPIFLSIGYSTCHWCHVMAKESFADPEVAALMNEAFVCIKVDREERPDLDAAYLAAAQLLSSPGGWPLTIVMTADKKPFFAGTYLPKSSRGGRLGLMEFIPRIREVWQRRREKLVSLADQVARELTKATPETAAGAPDAATLETAFQQLTSLYDPRHAGFGGAPKFPTPHNLTFLLRFWKQTGNPSALEMVEKTLVAMRQGGIYDHLGHGFHRYATDARWLVPHFEKMLSDQALLAIAYTEGFLASGRPEFAATVREIFAYVLRRLASPAGGFFSAEDADSEGVEGKFYLWTRDEVKAALAPAEVELIARVFNLRPEGNFYESGGDEPSGKNIFHLEKSLSALAPELGLSAEALETRVTTAREKLFAVRRQRVHPHLDDKVLADWNGLMIAALAKAAAALAAPEYLSAAARAADFILDTMRDEKGRLFHRYRDGAAAIPGFLDDYAFFIWGLLELYAAGFEVRYLRAALELADMMLESFQDRAPGGFFLTAADAEPLLFRQKEAFDSALPSGNSVAMLDLLRLARITARPELEAAAMNAIKAFSRLLQRMPAAFPQLLQSVDFALGPAYELVIVGETEAADTKALLAAAREKYIPNAVIVFRPAEIEAPEIAELVPYLRELKPLAGRAAAYVCRDFQCELPTADPKEMLRMLGEKF